MLGIRSLQLLVPFDKDSRRCIRGVGWFACLGAIQQPASSVPHLEPVGSAKFHPSICSTTSSLSKHKFELLALRVWNYHQHLWIDHSRQYLPRCHCLGASSSDDCRQGQTPLFPECENGWKSVCLHESELQRS